MYYFVNFTYKDEIMEADPDVTLLPCEWVVKADSKEEAIEQIKKDIELDENGQASRQDRALGRGKSAKALREGHEGRRLGALSLRRDPSSRHGRLDRIACRRAF